jgi:hypothetical protein
MTATSAVDYREFIRGNCGASPRPISPTGCSIRIAIAMQIAGVCYLVNSFALILVPALQDVLSAAILLPCFFAELLFCLWFLVKGVDASKWEARARAYR